MSVTVSQVVLEKDWNKLLKNDPRQQRSYQPLILPRFLADERHEVGERIAAAVLKATTAAAAATTT